MTRKHLLYLNNDHLNAYAWENGELTPIRRFDLNDAGKRDFSRFATLSARTPIYLFADLIEEDFVRETIPHAFGKTRRALLERKLNQHYRETAYRLATFQGRESEGRRDDQMLFSALTNGEWVGNWVAMLVKAKAPLAGVYSPALLSTGLIKKAGLTKDQLLLVSVHSCGLRQSFIQGAQLKFSRLTPLSDQTPDGVAAAVAEESRKIEQFLGTSRLLPRGKTMNVVVLDHGDTLPAMNRICSDTSTLAFRIVDTQDIAKACGLKAFIAERYCDTLFLSLLANSPPRTNYAQAEQVRYHRLWAARIGLYGASGAVLAAGVLWAGSHILEALDFDDQRVNADIERQSLQRQYEMLTQQFPKIPTSPENMKAAVQLYQTVLRNAPMPDALLVKISQALQAVPRIQIVKLKWEAVAPTPVGGEVAGSEQAPVAEASPDGLPPPIGGDMLGIPGKPEQQLLIEGEITPFQLDYRAALEMLKQFTAELEKDKSITATLTLPPLDVRPVAKITGNTAPQDEKAAFTLKLKWKPAP